MTRAAPISPNVSVHWQSPNEKNDKLTSSAKSFVVDNERMKFLRRSPQTELATSGQLSATQLDRLTGILKDKPVKKGLLLPKAYGR